VWKCNIVAHQLWVSLLSTIDGAGTTSSVCYVLGVEKWRKSYRLAVYGERCVPSLWWLLAGLSQGGGPGSCASPCGIYGEQSVIVTVFSVITSVLLSVSLHQ
jgi:hypothetical protein